MSADFRPVGQPLFVSDTEGSVSLRRADRRKGCQSKHGLNVFMWLIWALYFLPMIRTSLDQPYTDDYAAPREKTCNQTTLNAIEASTIRTTKKMAHRAASTTSLRRPPFRTQSPKLVEVTVATRMHTTRISKLSRMRPASPTPRA